MNRYNVKVYQTPSGRRIHEISSLIIYVYMSIYVIIRVITRYLYCLLSHYACITF